MKPKCPMCCQELKLIATSRDDQRWWGCKSTFCDINIRKLLVSFTFVGEDTGDMDKVVGITDARYEA